MLILGQFDYHIYSVKLECSDDEITHVVTCVESGITETHTFGDLGPARDAFEAACQNVLYRTSLTDVSIYEQQSASDSDASVHIRDAVRYIGLALANVEEDAEKTKRLYDLLAQLKSMDAALTTIMKKLKQYE